MPTSFRSLLVNGATPWHTGTGIITYSFLGTSMPGYVRQVDSNNDGLSDAYEVSPGDLVTTVEFGASFSMTAIERNLTLLAIAEWNGVANINLVAAVAGNTTGDIVFGSSAFEYFGAPDTALFGFVSAFPSGDFYLGLDQAVQGTPSYHGDLWINSNNPSQNLSEWGHTSGHTYIHELGHSLGLHHPDEDPGNYANDATNNNQYTVMSYVEHPGGGGSFDSQAWPITPMMYDIQALQELYGVNTTTRQSNTTYFGDNNGVGDAAYQYGAANMMLNGRGVILTIWDAGGHDVIDASDVTSSVRINLTPGTFSTIGSISENIGLAAAVSIDGEIINYIEDAIGTGRNDVITGNAAANYLVGRGGADRLNGGGGDDRLSGGAGADVLIGGGGTDVADYLGSASGVSADLVNGGQAGGARGDSYDTIENLGGSNLSDDLRGDNLANAINGNNGADLIVGRGGNDVLNGGGGDDIVMGGGNNDVLLGLDGNDVLNGGAGNDIMNGGNGNDRMVDRTGNNRMSGLDGDDVMIGGVGRVTMMGGRGADTMFDGTGDAIMFGGADRDRLIGGEGTDRLYGSNGNDTLNGGGGIDRISGDQGNDYMLGGAGADIFILRAGNGTDRIADFENDVDRLFIESALTGGRTNAANVVSTYASVVAGDVVFDFGGGNTLTLIGVSSTVDLADDLVFI